MSSVRALDDQPGSGGTLDTVTREAADRYPGAQAPASNVGAQHRAGDRAAVRGGVRHVGHVRDVADRRRLVPGRRGARPGVDRGPGPHRARAGAAARPVGAAAPVGLADGRLRLRRGGRLPARLLQRDLPDAGGHRPADRVHGHPARGGVAVGAARPAAAAADHSRQRRGDRRAGADAGPVGTRRHQPGRRALGAARRGQHGGVLHPVREGRRRPAAAGGHDVGRDDRRARSCSPRPA